MASPETTQVRTTPTTAERRALQQIKTAGDRFAVIAADHGQPLVDMLDGLGLSSAPEAQRAFKADLVDTVGRDASAVLLDPDVSLPDIVDRDLVARDVGLIVRIEADGYEEQDGLRQSQMIDGLGAQGARARGATAAKVMVFLRADREDLDGYTAQMVRAALEDCRRSDLLCVIELMTYRLDDETPEAFAARKEDLVVEGAVLLQECGSKVLKLEYPGSASGCRRVTDALESRGRCCRPASTMTRSAVSCATPWTAAPTASSRAARCGRRPSGSPGGAPPLPRRRRAPAHGGDARDRRLRGVAAVATRPGSSAHRRRRPPTARRWCSTTSAAGELAQRPARGRRWTRVADRRRDRPARSLARPRCRVGRGGARRRARGAGSPGRRRGDGRDRRPARRAAARRWRPAIAWHDARGADEAAAARRRARRARFAATHRPAGLAALLAEQAAAGSATTSPAPSAAVRWLGVAGVGRARRWAASRVAELSLASRTGLARPAQPRRWWADDAGVALASTRTSCAEPVPGDTPVGPRRRRAAPSARRRASRSRATTTVAAMVGAGADGEGDVLHSSGTSERVRAHDRAATSSPTRVAARGGGRRDHVGWHVMPGPLGAARAATSSDVAAGVRAPAARRRRRRPTATRSTAAAAALPATDLPLRLEGMGGGSPLSLHGIGAGVSPAHLWRAALEAGAELSAATLARSDAVGGPRRRIVATGGGVRGMGARAVKEQRLGPIEWSPVQEATARGAALLGDAAARIHASRLSRRAARG